MKIGAPRHRLQPLVALRALRGLVRSRGRDLTQAVIFMHAMEGTAGQRAFARFSRTAAGRGVLATRERLLARLADIAALERFPPGTLAQAYRAFQVREGLTVSGLMALATSAEDRPMTEDERLFEERARVQHDLWHVVTGHAADEFGELCLLAVRCAQLEHVGINLLCLGGMVKLARAHPGAGVGRAVFEGWRIGRAAEWLYGADWEGLLPVALEDVRRRLRVRPPVAYQAACAAMSAAGPDARSATAVRPS